MVIPRPLENSEFSKFLLPGRRAHGWCGRFVQRIKTVREV